MAKGNLAVVASEEPKQPKHRVVIRGQMKMRDLIAAGRVASVPITAGMLNRPLDDMPMEVLLGIIAVNLIREQPGLTYDAVLDLIDAGEVELVQDNTDPKSTSARGSATS